MSDIRELLSELDEEFILMDGFDDCIEGICKKFGEEPVVCYDYDKVIAKLQSDGMTYEEAVEFHEYNQVGAYLGAKTPCFITKYIKHGDSFS
jgi:hypothetical protein